MDNNYIDNSIQSLIQLLGIHDSAPVAQYISLIRTGQVKECIEAIARYLNLPIKINLMYVSPEDIGHTQFQSNGLVNTNREGRGVEGITAQVLIPPDLPLYGSERFNNMTFTVKISREATNNPQTFIGVMAHELTHVVLFSLWYKDKDSEVQTDIAAMLLGFADAMKYGRKVIKDETPFISSGNYRQTSTTTYGYLNDQQFDYAYGKVSALIKDREKKLSDINKKLNAVASSLMLLEKNIKFFEKWLSILEKRGSLKMRPEDSQQIMSFYYPGFLEDIKDQAGVIRKSIGSINIKNLQPHKPASQDVIHRITENLEANQIRCRKLLLEMIRNNKLIVKHLGLKNQIMIKVKSIFGF